MAGFERIAYEFKTWIGFMADQGLEGSQPVDLSKHPSGIVPTLQWVSLNSMFSHFWIVIASMRGWWVTLCFGWFDSNGL